MLTFTNTTNNKLIPYSLKCNTAFAVPQLLVLVKLNIFVHPIENSYSKFFLLFFILNILIPKVLSLNLYLMPSFYLRFVLYLRVDQLWHNTTHPAAYTEPTSHSVLAQLRLGPSCLLQLPLSAA